MFRLRLQDRNGHILAQRRTELNYVPEVLTWGGKTFTRQDGAEHHMIDGDDIVYFKQGETHDLRDEDNDAGKKNCEAVQ